MMSATLWAEVWEIHLGRCEGTSGGLSTCLVFSPWGQCWLQEVVEELESLAILKHAVQQELLRMDV
jgi:hypothetical protein